jgi:predicted transcriptional regulator
MVAESDVITLQMECTLFFENNPYALETSSGMSKRLGRNANLIERALNRLTELSILEKNGQGTRAIYRYKTPYVQTEVDMNAYD